MKDLKKLGNFELIINNAGLADPHPDTDQTAWEKVLRLNTVVPALLLAHADTMVRDNGQVINISSAYGHERFGEKGYAVYSASKAALNSITRTFAKQLAPRVRVNGIAPGYVDPSGTRIFRLPSAPVWPASSSSASLLPPTKWQI